VRHEVTHGTAAVRVVHGGDDPRRLVERNRHRGGQLSCDPRTVHLDDVCVAVNLGSNVGDTAVDADASRRDEVVGAAA